MSAKNKIIFISILFYGSVLAEEKDSDVLSLSTFALCNMAPSAMDPGNIKYTTGNDGYLHVDGKSFSQEIALKQNCLIAFSNSFIPGRLEDDDPASAVKMEESEASGYLVKYNFFASCGYDRNDIYFRVTKPIARGDGVYQLQRVKNEIPLWDQFATVRFVRSKVGAVLSEFSASVSFDNSFEGFDKLSIKDLPLKYNLVELVDNFHDAFAEVHLSAEEQIKGAKWIVSKGGDDFFYIKSSSNKANYIPARIRYLDIEAKELGIWGYFTLDSQLIFCDLYEKKWPQHLIKKYVPKNDLNTP